MKKLSDEDCEFLRSRLELARDEEMDVISENWNRAGRFDKLEIEMQRDSLKKKYERMFSLIPLLRVSTLMHPKGEL